MLPRSLPPLYAILDPEQTKGRSPESVLRELLEGGVTLLQLRVKAMAPREFFELARTVRSRTRAHGCQLIVNDRVDIALACDADGVHLGQDDLPLRVGRKLMGSKIVGISTHNRNGADYIGFGPMFGTTTKATGYSARGVEMLRQIRATVKLPIVAIGGISEQNVREVWQAGADSAAIISDLLGADDVIAKTKRIVTSRSAI
jgi:thiamine-phosphate diphosphorylase